MSGLNDYMWKVTEEQGTKDWFLLIGRFMLTSTSAVHTLRKLEKTNDVPYELKEAADATANLLKMHVPVPLEPGHMEAVMTFTQHLRALPNLNMSEWYIEDYLGKRITVPLIKQALHQLRVSLGGKTSKAELGNLLTQNLNMTVPSEDEGDKEMALSVLNKWFMSPIKGEATKGLREGLASEAEVLRLLKAFFVGAIQKEENDHIVVVKVIHVGLLESKVYERVGTSVDAIVLLKVTNAGSATSVYELACVEIKTKTSANTIAEQECKLLSGEVATYEYLTVTSSEESATAFQNCVDVVDHRCQTLHHAATLGVKKTIYIVAA